MRYALLQSPAFAVGLLCATAINGLAEMIFTTPRLLNTEIFGRSTGEAVVLLEPKSAESVSPETILVDIDKDRYFAATIRYPKTLGFEDVRRTLNERYGEWERKSFAKDPTMGIWRNEKERIAIQLTEDEYNVVLIYIKFSLVSDDIMDRSVKRALRDLDEDLKCVAPTDTKTEGQDE